MHARIEVVETVLSLTPASSSNIDAETHTGQWCLPSSSWRSSPGSCTCAAGRGPCRRHHLGAIVGGQLVSGNQSSLSAHIETSPHNRPYYNLDLRRSIIPQAPQTGVKSVHETCTLPISLKESKRCARQSGAQGPTILFYRRGSFLIISLPKLLTCYHGEKADTFGMVHNYVSSPHSPSNKAG
jgi:hypothetical protein